MKCLVPLFAAMLLAGCNQPADGEEAPATVNAEQPQGAQLPPPGEYRLAGADGEDVNLGHAITVSIGEDEIAVASQCVAPRWSYRRQDGAVVTQPIPEPICERGLYPAEEALFAVFDDPQVILRTPSNGWFLEGGGHSVTLFSQ